MTPVSPRYSKEEFARRGDEIYEREVLPRLTSEDEGKYALIDIEAGDYEIDRDELAASDRLFARRPDAQVWFRQVGSPLRSPVRTALQDGSGLKDGMITGRVKRLEATVGQAVLGDGSTVVFDTYEAVILWNGRTRRIAIDCLFPDRRAGHYASEGPEGTDRT